MSENVPPSPEGDPPGILEVSARSLQALLNSKDDALSNSVRRVTEDAKRKENYAAFGNVP